jgi:7-keto-8-aminopelargonate synthetase-like enzyme
MFSAFMSLQNQRHFFVCFFNFSSFSTLLRAIFSIAKDAEHLSSRLDSLIQDFGSLLKQAGSSVLPSPLPTQEIVIDNAGHRTLLHPPQKKNKTPPKTHQKKTIYKSDNSLAPRGTPSPKTCHEE